MAYQTQEQIPTYTIGDRINHPFILAREWEKIDEVLIRVEGEQSRQEVLEAVYSFESSIPDELKDDMFLEEKARADKIIIVDKRKEFMGKKIGKPILEDETETDPYKLKRACVNLLQRKGRLSRQIFVEDVTGERFPSEPTKQQAT